MELNEIIEELCEKRFVDRAKKIIDNFGEKDTGSYDDRSRFDYLLQNFIEEVINEYLKTKKEELKKIVISKLNLEDLELDCFNSRFRIKNVDYR